MEQICAYRNWVEDKDLVSFSVKMQESDLFIRADKFLNSQAPLDSKANKAYLTGQARQCLGCLRGFIQDYIRKKPEFAGSLEPYSVEAEAADIVRDMAKASFSAGVGPMAAVAGAIAEYVGRELLKYSSQVIVENGGDIFMKTDRIRKVGIFAGKSPYTGKLALEIAPSKDCWGICTSSATVGPSLSFGKADAAVVVSHCAILADAWATRLANMVKSESDVEKTLSVAEDTAEIKGVVIIIGERIGAWGEVKLVHS